jgi:hypothetical protein
MTHQRILNVRDVKAEDFKELLVDTLVDIAERENGRPNKIAMGVAAYDLWLRGSYVPSAASDSLCGPNGKADVRFDKLLHKWDVHIFEEKK